MHKRMVPMSLVAALVVMSAQVAHPVRVSAQTGSCSASSTLNSVGDALTGGKDADVLTAALRGERRLMACGDVHDAIGAELIAADAYGDVNKPAQRCSILRAAAKQSAKLGDTKRSRLIERAQASCSRK